MKKKLVSQSPLTALVEQSGDEAANAELQGYRECERLLRQLRYRWAGLLAVDLEERDRKPFREVIDRALKAAQEGGRQ